MTAKEFQTLPPADLIAEFVRLKPSLKDESITVIRRNGNIATFLVSEEIKEDDKSWIDDSFYSVYCPLSGIWEFSMLTAKKIN